MFFDDSYGAAPAYMAGSDVPDAPQSAQKNGMSREATTTAGVVVRQYSDGTLLVLNDPSGKIEDGTMLTDASDPRWIRATMDIGTWASYAAGEAAPKVSLPEAAPPAPRGADATPSVTPEEPPAAKKAEFPKWGWFFLGVAATVAFNKYSNKRF